MDTPKTTHVSLCAGYGGLDLGLRRVIPNLCTVAASEIEAYAIENLIARMESGALDPAPIWPDLKTFPWAAFRDRVDILSGGYPCQPFSAAGKRAGAEDPRHLWPFISAGIAIMRPRLCFFENVEGHISLGLSDVIEDLAGMGYRTTFGIFSAEEVGAPHRRKRVYILADRNSGRGEIQDQGQLTSEKMSQCNGSSQGAWPARPGEQQHEWEEPRVLADPKRIGWEWGEPAARSGEGVFKMRGFAESDKANGLRDSKPARQAQPNVGRATHGSANRVDRLRLLGNGVVPAAAALAFKTLYDELT